MPSIPDMPKIGGGWVRCARGRVIECSHWGECGYEHRGNVLENIPGRPTWDLIHFPDGVPSYCPGIRLAIVKAETLERLEALETESHESEASVGCDSCTKGGYLGGWFDRFRALADELRRVG